MLTAKSRKVLCPTLPLFWTYFANMGLFLSQWHYFLRLKNYITEPGQIMSNFNHCLLVWVSFNATSLEKIENLQKEYCDFCTKTTSCHTMNY